MKESTKTLYEAVAQAIGMEDGIAPGPKEKEFLDRIASEHFNDFLSESVYPISNLIANLQILGLQALADRAKAGDFDATAAEAKEYLMSGEADETMVVLGIDAEWAKKHAKPRSNRPATSASIEDDPASFRESA